MKFRCNRLGYLFIKRHAMEALSIYGGFFLLPTVTIFLFFGMDALKIWIFFPAFFVLATVLVLFSLIYLPRWIALDGKKLMWEEKLNVRRDEVHQYVAIYRWRALNLPATITVGDLHAIEFLQTPIERLFNIGRIRFLGDIRSMEAREPVERPIIPFYYGGICKFDQFQAKLRKELSDSAFQKAGEK